MEKEEIITQHYYLNKVINYYMLGYTHKRELVFLSEKVNVRGLIANHSKFIESHFNNYRVWKINPNMYYSLARTDKIPYMSYNPIKRKEKMKDLDKAYDEILSFDLGLDFDNPTKDEAGFELAKLDTIKVVEHLLNLGVRFSVRFSGSGFHIVIPDFRHNTKMKDYPKMIEDIQKISTYLKNSLDLKTLDESVFDVRRIWRLPFSINQKTKLVSVPLDHTQIKEFSWGVTTPLFVLSHLNDFARNRGDYYPNKDYTDDWVGGIIE